METKKDEWYDEDKVVYLPMEDIRAFERILDKMEQAQEELHEIRDNMKPIDNDEIDNQALQ
jgi:uncharacterized protein YdcH (DUF465 family)